MGSSILSITCDIQNSSDANLSLDVRRISLDMSKPFDRVWHGGPLFKIKRFGLNGRY